MSKEWVFILLSTLLFLTIVVFFVIKKIKIIKNQAYIYLNQIDSLVENIRPYNKLEKYLEKSTFLRLLKEQQALYESIPFFVFKYLEKTINFKEFKQSFIKWKAIKYQQNLSEQYITSKLNNPIIKNYFDNFTNLSLDMEQRRVVIDDDFATLVIAAAGSGKTLTLAAKVAYLVNFQKIDPNKILLITFTDKASKEMEERVLRSSNLHIQSYTFHKLGLKILAEKYGYKPSIVNEDSLDSIIQEYINNDLKNNISNTKDFIELFAYYNQTFVDESDYTSLTSYSNDMKSSDLETLKSQSNFDKEERKTIKGERVKSLAELQIANYLYIHGIDYQYEEKYKYVTATKTFRQYQPDFYLPAYDIYIEHFGIDRNNQAKWLNKAEENKYLRGMMWKKNIHKAQGTKLIETYSYMAHEGNLLSELEKKLIEYDVKFNLLDQQQIINQIISINTRYFQEFQKLIKTFILLLKESGKINENRNILLDKLISKKEVNRYRARLFLKLITPIIDKYENQLKLNNEIDFSDMIHRAKEYLINHNYLDYDYILVDEYQDISESKSQFIDALIKKDKTKLFCVGDDWQSIFRFAGSDINQFMTFQNRYPSSCVNKIQKTYRNPQELVNIASQFIMNNNQQIFKKIVSTKSLKNPLFLYNQGESLMVNMICKIVINLLDIHPVQEILILGRYNFDLNKEELYQVRAQFPDIDINFLTVHKAKGLEAEHVIIINNKNHILGFPSKIADDELLTMVLSHQDDYPHAEERRLFYVALTRAKYTCHLIVQANTSIFIEELIKENKDLVLNEITSREDRYSCPKCDGYIVKRSGNDEDFYRCSNYPYCDYNASININFNKSCPSCGDYMIKRRGPSGLFWGCNSFYTTGCKHTQVYLVNNEDENDRK
jgi:DNA helicase-4